MRYVLFCLVICVLFVGCVKQSAESVATPAPVVQAETPKPVFFKAMGYGMFSGIENPACGPYPSKEDIGRDLDIMAKVTKKIRIYSLVGVQAEIPKLAAERGIETIGGCWLSKDKALNEVEFQALVKAAKQGYLKKLVVGNEVILREDLSIPELVSYIKRLKKETNLPVGYADVNAVWCGYPELYREVDFILVHIYAFWDKIPVEEAVSHTIKTYQLMKEVYPNKEIIIGELGWPKSGEANGRAFPSVANQDKFVRKFVAEAERLSIPYYYFEAFDEEWKITQEGGVGSSWGWQLLHREPRWKKPAVTKFPFIVYDDMAITSHFIPSGWMGDIEAISLDNDCTTRPHSGKTCIRIDWTGGFFPRWSGIYWQYPEDNWGDMPGYVFRGVKKLTFWARGEKGGEVSTFKIGGIDDAGKKYRDSLGIRQHSFVKLTKEWKKYEITIPENDLDCVISGMCWVTSDRENSHDITIYLDDIQFE